MDIPVLRFARRGHEFLSNSGAVICYPRKGRSGQLVRVQNRHRCPFCSEHVLAAS